jgi:hypothetical protein
MARPWFVPAQGSHSACALHAIRAALFSLALAALCGVLAYRFWREPSSAPMYATGAEFSWTDGGFEQGSKPSPLSPHDYDVPRFLAAIRAVLAAPAASAGPAAATASTDGAAMDAAAAGALDVSDASAGTASTGSASAAGTSAAGTSAVGTSAGVLGAFDSLPYTEQLERLFGGAPKGASSTSPGSRKLTLTLSLLHLARQP